MAALRDFTLLQPRARLDSAFYDRLRANARSAQMRDQFTIPPFQGRGFIVRKGQSFRIVQVEGVQIGDVAFWNVDHPTESYSLARTWAIEGWVTRPYTRVWSDVPWLRPLATCIEDTVVNTEPEFHHHWLGTHCATEWTEMRVAIPGLNSCHLNLLQAIEPFGLTEANLRDNINLFQKMKVDPDSGRILAAPSESKTGDYIEFYAERTCWSPSACAPMETTPATIVYSGETSCGLWASRSTTPGLNHGTFPPGRTGGPRGKGSGRHRRSSR